MNSADMRLVTMPKWGLAMTKGKVVAWLVEEGANLHSGLELAEVETEKILTSIESPSSGILRRKVAHEGDVVAVGGLVGVIAEALVPDAQIDSAIAEFRAPVLVEAKEKGQSFGQQAVEVQGRRLAYLRMGDNAEPVILIHGFGGNLSNWMFNHEALAEKHTVYALDLPGHGSSSKKVETGTVTEFVGVLNGFIDSLGVTRGHFIGHSMGGAIAVAFAANHPERVQSLVLIASAGLGLEINEEYIRGFITAGRRKEIKRHLEKLFADPRLASQQLVDEILRYKRLDGVEEALSTIATAFFPAGQQAVSLREQLSQLRLPTLILWGADDLILPVSHAQALPKEIKTEILHGYGHMVHMEASAKVNQIISSFWESIVQ